MSELILDMTFRVRHGKKVIGKVNERQVVKLKNLATLPWYVTLLGYRLIQDAHSVWELLEGEQNERSRPYSRTKEAH